jgi:predicted N-acetyltransferase YhbS
MLAAKRLYRRFGFEPAADYNGKPRAGRFMVLPLR